MIFEIGSIVRALETVQRADPPPSGHTVAEPVVGVCRKPDHGSTKKLSVSIALRDFRRIAATWLKPQGGADFRIKAGLTWFVLLAGLVSFLAVSDLKFALIAEKLPFLLGLRLSPDGFVQGMMLTLLITACSMVFSSLLGVITALGRLSANPIAFGLATFYASLFRGTPLLIQVLMIYLALPQVGIVLGGLSSGIIALSLNYGAYLAEIIRSGISAVPVGQREAALALGLPRWTIAWRIVAPQALRIIVPPIGSQFISMLKDSSLVSLMGLWELNFLAQAYGRASYRYMEMLTTAAAIYWCLSIIFECVQARLEQRFGKGFAQPVARVRR